MTDGGEELVPVLHVGGDVGGDADGQRLPGRVGHEGERHDVLVPRRDEGEDHRGHDAGQRERQHDPQQRPQPPAAVDRRGLLDLAGDRGEEGAQDPDGERQVEGGVGQDERRVRVDQARARRTRGRARPPAPSARTSGSPAPGTGTPSARGTGGARCSRRPASRPAARCSVDATATTSELMQPALKAGIAEDVEEVAGLPAHRREPRRRDPQLALGLERGQQHHEIGRQQRPARASPPAPGSAARRARSGLDLPPAAPCAGRRPPRPGSSAR